MSDPYEREAAKAAIHTLQRELVEVNTVSATLLTTKCRELAEVTKQRDELLEALEKLLDRSWQFTDDGPLLEGWKSDEFTAEIEQAESAIAKVKGGGQ